MDPIQSGSGGLRYVFYDIRIANVALQRKTVFGGN